MTLTINAVIISKTSNDLYSANDLHKASGGKDSKAPSKFTILKRTKDLIDQIMTTGRILPPLESVIGDSGGTFMCKELLLGYASWLSPQVDLAVIQGFLSIYENPDQLVEQATKMLPPGISAIIIKDIKPKRSSKSGSPDVPEEHLNSASLGTVRNLSQDYGVTSKDMYNHLASEGFIKFHEWGYWPTAAGLLSGVKIFKLRSGSKRKDFYMAFPLDLLD